MATQDLTSSGTPEFAGVTVGSDPVVGRDTTDTLTNKTLTSPIINSPSSSGDVYSGVYTPTGTGETNIDSITEYEALYTRVGAMVHVSGFISINPTAGGGAYTVFRCTLPIASDLVTVQSLNGAANSNSATAVVPVVVSGDTTNEEARFMFYAQDSTTEQVFFVFMYKIA